jgi:ubiquinone/menaquinone biosynthesis C-methylase UbiE
MRDPSGNWEAIAQREPYFGVLTDPRFLGDASPAALDEFFASGERDAERLLALAAAHIGTPPWHPSRVLDFGCGVGRLTLAFARRAQQATGIDVSPTMLALARTHRERQQLANAEFVDASALDTLADGGFDFVVSLIVFQHIPVRDGEALLRALLRKLAPGGVAALHFTFRRRGGALRRAARRLRASIPLLHRALQRIAGDPLRLPYMEMNEYDLERLRAAFREAGCDEPTLAPTDHGGIAGAILVAQRRV